MGMASSKGREGEMEPYAEKEGSVCKNCKDLKRELLTTNDIVWKFPISLSQIRANDSCSYCKLLVDAMHEIGGLDSMTTGRWHLRAKYGLVLEGENNGTKYQLEFYITQGMLHSGCIY
jgi:hypothetical protein